jgi:hypothetical protein
MEFIFALMLSFVPVSIWKGPKMLTVGHFRDWNTQAQAVVVVSSILPGGVLHHKVFDCQSTFAVEQRV